MSTKYCPVPQSRMSFWGEVYSVYNAYNYNMKDLLVLILILHNLDSCTETGYLESYIRRRKSENLWSSGHWNSKKNQKRLQAAPSVIGFMQFHWLETQVFMNGHNFGDAIAKVQLRCWSSACLSCFFSLGQVRFWWESFSQKASSIFCACPLNQTYCKNDQEWGSIVTCHPHRARTAWPQWIASPKTSEDIWITEGTG